MSKRFLALFLSAAVLLSLTLSATGCKNKAIENTTSPTATAATTSSATTAAASTISPTPAPTEIPPIDMGGRVVKIYSTYNDIYAGNKTGDALDIISNQTAAGIEFRKRVTEVQKKYNCKITFVGQLSGAFWDKVSASNLAGSPIADFGTVGIENIYSNLTQAGAYMALDRFNDILKLDDPTLWNQNVNKTMLRSSNTQLAVSPRIAGITVPNVGFVTFFNKSMLIREGIWKQYNLYDMQKNKTWNWKTFNDICRKLTKDTNSDGEPDQFGANYSEIMLRALMHTNVTTNGKGGFVNVTDNGKASVVIGDKQHKPALEFLASMYKNGGLTSVTSAGSGSDVTALQLFIAGKLGFTMDYGNRLEMMRTGKMVDTIGIVAIPLSPTGRKDYILPANGFSAFVISAGVKKPIEIAHMMRQLLPPLPKTAEEEQVETETYLSKFIGGEQGIIDTFTMLADPDRISTDIDGVFLGGIGIPFWIFYYNMSTVITGTITSEQLIQMSLPKIQTTCNDWWSGVQKGLTKMKKEVAAGKK